MYVQVVSAIGMHCTTVNHLYRIALWPFLLLKNAHTATKCDNMLKTSVHSVQSFTYIYHSQMKLANSIHVYSIMRGGFNCACVDIGKD